jgi:predicted transcriptional regulator
MENGITFALPTLDSSSMSRADQEALIVNQATAVIVDAYLKHATEMAAHRASVGGSATTSVAYLITAAELPGLINQVQDALKSF